MEIDSFLRVAALKFGLKVKGSAKFGFDKRSAGCLCVRGNEIFWLKLKNLKKTFSKESNLWTGEVDSQIISGVAKPTLIDFKDWEDEEFYWRATVSSAVQEEVWSETPYLLRPVEISQDWLTNLKTSLEALKVVSTERNNIRQDLIDRRLKEYFGSSFDSQIKTWVTCHGDLHWANLTKDSPVLLDWEAWGKGPRGLDPAFLIAFSVDHPQLVSAIERAFAEELSSSDGVKAQLFILVELIRMCDLHREKFHPQFVQFKKSLVERLKKVGS